MRRGAPRLFLILVLWSWTSPLAGTAWPWQVAARGSATALALDAGGNVLVSASLPGIFFLPKIEIVKLARGSGRRLWRYRDGFGAPAALALAPAGDVIAVGYTRLGGFAEPPLFAVIEVDGREGTERWRIDMPSGSARAVAADPQGDVMAAGVLGSAFAVVRLAGDTGATRWTHTVAGDGVAMALALDGAGDVIAAGSVDGALVVVKLVGATGAQIWRRSIPGGAAQAVAIAPAGDVAVVGFITEAGEQFAVLRLAGGGGAEVWRTVLPDGNATTVALDWAGDVVAAGALAEAGTRRFGVVKLAGGSGAERWRRTVGVGADADRAAAVVVDPVGDVIATGSVSPAGRGPTFATVTLAGATGVVRRQRLLDGTGRDGDVASGAAVAVDGHGYVIAAGSLRRRRHGVDTQRLVVRRLRAS